jgi:leucyl aminopeptidase
MPSVSFSAALPEGTDAVVVGVISGPRLAPGAEAVDATLGGRLLEAIEAVGGSGRPDEVVKIPTLGLAPFPLVVATGLGDGRTGDRAEAARRAVGAAARALNATARVHIALDAPAAAVVEGALLGGYTFTQYKSAKPKGRTRAVTVAAGSRSEIAAARAVATAVIRARDLVNTPPNDLYPAAFADRAAELARTAGLDVDVLDERGLRRGRFGGILAVGAGSARAPRLVRIEYRPRRPLSHLALVGKGITYDAGGVNLKTAQLTWMKSDMGGAAAVVAATCAIAALKLPIAVTATVPMAENMPSGSAYRPSDIVTLRDGSTVEVTNTDNEGRVVLADAIARALDDEPDALIDIATLTSGQLIALGPRLIGAMGTDELRETVVAAATARGEAVWPMPLPADLRPGLDSPVADLVNQAPERWGSMLVGGLFLREFVPAGLPWVHLDIAGPAWNAGAARDYTPKGGTGAGVRTLIATAERLTSR